MLDTYRELLSHVQDLSGCWHSGYFIYQEDAPTMFMVIDEMPNRLLAPITAEGKINCYLPHGIYIDKYLADALITAYLSDPE